MLFPGFWAGLRKLLAGQPQQQQQQPPQPPDTASRGWIPVDSSWLVEVLYDSGTLWIRYKSGVICQYQNVPLSMWLGLRNAPSKGKWIHANLIRWPYKLL